MRQRFWDNLTMVGSILYALCVIFLGTLIYLYDIIVKDEADLEVQCQR